MIFKNIKTTLQKTVQLDSMLFMIMYIFNTNPMMENNAWRVTITIVERHESEFKNA